MDLDVACPIEPDIENRGRIDGVYVIQQQSVAVAQFISTASDIVEPRLFETLAGALAALQEQLMIGALLGQGI